MKPVHPETIAGRYRVLRELGRGGMGVVYLVQEDGRPAPIALKALDRREFSESALRRFEMEFRTLTGLSHPNLTEVYDFGRAPLGPEGRDVPFFTMEYVDGLPIDRALGRPPLDFPAIYRGLAQLGQALAYLHARGWVHQDVKPANILVAAPAGGRETLKLMDLGLSGRAREKAGPGVIRGTVAFLSPEAARGDETDPRSDLYALGCVAYQLVTGRPPFQGSSPLAVLRSHLHEAPLPPSSFNREIPAPFEALMLRLLAKDPGRRPASADRFLEQLNLVAGGGIEIGTPESRRTRVLGAGFTGRLEELSRLDALLGDVRAGASRVALLEGEAGVGKSRLLREFQVRCQIDGIDAVVGRPDPHGGAGAALAEALAGALRRRGPLPEATAAAHGGVVARLLGTSAAADDGAESNAVVDRFDVIAAVEAVLADLARESPLVVAMDDLHLADEITCAVVRHVARASSREGGPRLLVLGTVRADEVSRTSPLFDLLAESRDEGLVEEIVLRPLGSEEVASLLCGMTGAETIPAPLLERVLDETRGNPLHLSEWVALLAEEGLIDPASGSLPDPQALDRAKLPARVRDLFERRLQRVPSDSLGILEAAAVLATDVVDPDAIAVVTGGRSEAVARRLDDLAASGLVIETEDERGETAFRLARPGIAALALERLPEEARRRLHAATLRYVESRGVPRRSAAWAAVAHHAEEAGLAGRAVEAWGRAGDLAREIHATREAIACFDHAVDLLLRQGEAPAAALCGLYQRRADCRFRSGDLLHAEEDARWMLARAEKAGSDLLRARAHSTLGDILLARDDAAAAIESLELGLEIAERLQEKELAARTAVRLGRAQVRRGQHDEAIAGFDRAAELARDAVHSGLEVEALLAKGELQREQGQSRAALATLEQARQRAGRTPPAGVETSLLAATALSYEVQGKLRESQEAWERVRDLARARGDVPAIAGATAALGAIRVRTGDHERARADLEEALELHRRIGSREGMIGVLQELARFHLAQGRPEAALETVEDALRQTRRTAPRELAATSLALAGGIHLGLGDLDRADACLTEAGRILRDGRNPRAHAVLLADLGDLRQARGDAAEARKLFQESAFLARKVADRRLEASALVRLGDAHLRENDFDRAAVACRKAAALVEGAGLPREEADAFLLRARIELSRPGGDVMRAEIDALEAGRRFEILRETDGLWQAEHLGGKAALRLGRRDEAVERIGRAHQTLDGIRARLGERHRGAFLRDPRRRDLADEWSKLRTAPSRESRPGDPVAAGELARLRAEGASLRRLLDLNRELATTRDPGDLLPAILDAALALTGAERGFLLLRDGAEVTTRAARGATGSDLAGDALALSRSVARRALDSGEAILATDAETDERLQAFASIHDLRIRAVLAVPLRVKGESIGALYLDSRLDRGVFEATHLELASRLADQAAIALDTTRLLAHIEEQRTRLDRLNQELESLASAQRAELADAREQLVSTRSSLELRYRFDELVGGSPIMQKVYHLIERLAPKKLPVLVVGESGTGKELIARALHYGSERGAGPLVDINCAAIGGASVEYELFGHEIGAFPGASTARTGLLELAAGGTLFMDEICGLEERLQGVLLRALEQRTFMRVGGRQKIELNARLIAATNRDISRLVADGSFRSDLFYRINTISIALPPLRERVADIPLLADYFLKRLGGATPPEISEDAIRVMQRYRWPGNVRELRNVIERAVLLARNGAIEARDLPLQDVGAGMPAVSGTNGHRALLDVERAHILGVLQQVSWHQGRAASILGISSKTLYRKIREYGFQRPVS